jgi:hypothetical protein
MSPPNGGCCQRDGSAGATSTWPWSSKGAALPSPCDEVGPGVFWPRPGSGCLRRLAPILCGRCTRLHCPTGLWYRNAPAAALTQRGPGIQRREKGSRTRTTGQLMGRLFVVRVVVEIEV